jgi:hypothetical protein
MRLSCSVAPLFSTMSLFCSGIGQLALDYLWQTTAEGDFIVMQACTGVTRSWHLWAAILTTAPQLTTGKFLIKSLRSALAGNQVSGPCEYMRAASKPAFSREKLLSDSELTQATTLTPDNIGICATFVANVALILLLDAHDDASVAERNGLKGEAVWNRVAVQLVDAVKVGSATTSARARRNAIQPPASGALQRFHDVIFPHGHRNGSIRARSARSQEHRCRVRVQHAARCPSICLSLSQT